MRKFLINIFLTIFATLFLTGCGEVYYITYTPANPPVKDWTYYHTYYYNGSHYYNPYYGRYYFYRNYPVVVTQPNCGCGTKTDKK